MDNLDNLKKDLDSTKTLKIIVDTMKTLSATNIKNYEKATINLLRYIDVLHLGFQVILKQYPNIIDYFDYFDEDNIVDNKLLTLSIVIGSNQGLCGKFNDKVIDFFSKHIKNDGEKHFVITIGDRLNSILRARNIIINSHFSLPASLNAVGELVYNILSIIDDTIKNKHFKKVRVYYTEYSINNTLGSLTRKRLLPLDKQYFINLSQKEWLTYQTPIWNVSTKQICLDLTKQYLLANLSSMLISSMTVEQKNRLFTLQSAEKNIDEHISNLTLYLNQVRQTTITSNLIDIIGGFKNLKKHNANAE